MRLLNDRVLVEADKPPEKSSGGLYVVEEWKSLPSTGTVVEVGPKVSEVKKGDRVIFERYASVVFKGQQRMCQERHILAVVTDE